MRIIISVDTTAKVADDIAEVLCDYLIHVEGVAVQSYEVEKD
jgi:hypothetical protein